MHTRPDCATTTEWLARAHDDPEAARWEWADRPVAVLPLGRRFDAVRIPAEVAYAAIGTTHRAAAGPLLAAALDGAAIQDGESWLYALVPPGGAAHWSAPTGTYLARGWLGVPRTTRVGPPGLYWAVEMTTPGKLCTPTAVARLVELGFARLSGEVAP